MFGHKKLLEAVQHELKQHTWQQTWRLEQLERDNSSLRTWSEKVRSKNSALRKDRRRLRQLLEDNNIPWSPGN